MRVRRTLVAALGSALLAPACAGAASVAPLPTTVTSGPVAESTVGGVEGTPGPAEATPATTTPGTTATTAAPTPTTTTATAATTTAPAPIEPVDPTPSSVAADPVAARDADPGDDGAEAIGASSADAVAAPTDDPADEVTDEAAGPADVADPSDFSVRRGLVWESAVDPDRVNTDVPRPSWEADGVTAELDMVIVAPGSDPACVAVNAREGTSAPVCLIVQVRVDVGEVDVDDDHPQATAAIDAVITYDRDQLDSAVVVTGYPGTRDRTITDAFPGAASGSTVKIRTGTEASGWTVHDYVVPAGLPPLDF